MGMSASADYQKGLTAAQGSDYATALREWTPLADLSAAQKLARECVRKKYKGCSVEPNQVSDRHSLCLFPSPALLLTHPFNYHAVP